MELNTYLIKNNLDINSCSLLRFEKFLYLEETCHLFSGLIGIKNNIIITNESKDIVDIEKTVLMNRLNVLKNEKDIIIKKLIEKGE